LLANFGPDGTEFTNFERANGVAVDQHTGAVYVLDGNAGTLYKFNPDGTPLPFSGSSPNIEGNKLTGLSETEGVRQVAVDSTSHRVYVTEKTDVRAFEADGEPAEFPAGPGAGTNAIPEFSEVSGVAVDDNGAIYISDRSAELLKIYEPTGALLKTINASNPRNLAIGSNGDIFVITGDFEITRFAPSSFPVTESTTYAASPFLQLFSAIQGLGVDRLSGDVYVLENTSSDWIGQYEEDGIFVQYIGRSGDEGQLGVGSEGLAVVGGGVEFQIYSVNTTSEMESKVAIFGEEIIEEAPSIRGTSAIDVTADSAILKAEVNSNTAATTYKFEYGLEPCATGTCASLPITGGEIAPGRQFVSISGQLSGLEPDSIYHYRVVAKNSFGPSVGPELTLMTQPLGLSFQLADSRVWEMVSPTEKHGAKILGPGVGSTVQAAEDGEGLAYLTGRSIEAEPQGNRAVEASFVLARRDAAGKWSARDITPPHTETTIIARPGSEYQLFSSDLGRAIVRPADGTPLSPEATERTDYLRENTEPPNFIPLLTSKEGISNVPPGTKFGGEDVENRSSAYALAATEDLGHIVLASDVPLIEGAPVNAIYEWEGGQLHAISRLPASEGGNWYEGPGLNKVELGSGRGSVVNAVSSDGSRVFWSPGAYDESGISLNALYLRNVESEETVRLDLPQGGSGAEAARPVFQGASADGTVVFFTDTQQLTAGSSLEGRDLYRCEIPAGNIGGGCATLLDVTPAPGSGESTEVLGLVSGLGKEGTMLSFVARGVLDTAPNSVGETAVAGAPNLYRWRQGQGPRFVATLSEEDRRDWGFIQSTLGVLPYGTQLTAAGSPSGRYFAFMSERALTGQGNLDASTGEPVQQVFVYDAQADQLRCASCGFSGEAPRGKQLPTDRPARVEPAGLWSGRRLAAILPDPSATGGEGPFSSLYRPRTVLDNGRVFFNSATSLVPGDSNGQWDVYEFEPTGVGSCAVGSRGAAVASSSFGCVALISSGTGEEEAAFLDASTSGNDVFFTTPARLSVLDEDTIDDVYNARSGGIAAQRPVVNECLGEACRSAPPMPASANPASAGFYGAGNVVAACGKGKHRIVRKGHARCVPRNHKHRKHKHSKRARRGRAGR
jgi:DNA-binding beta-propeller fold protein YncE